jgi:hypothetical protein
MYGTPRLSAKCLAGQTLNSVCPPNHGRLGTRYVEPRTVNFARVFAPIDRPARPRPGRTTSWLFMLVCRGASEDGSDAIMIILHDRPIPAFPPSSQVSVCNLFASHITVPSILPRLQLLFQSRSPVHCLLIATLPPPQHITSHKRSALPRAITPHRLSCLQDRNAHPNPIPPS